MSNIEELRKNFCKLSNDFQELTEKNKELKLALQNAAERATSAEARAAKAEADVLWEKAENAALTRVIKMFIEVGK